MATKTQKAVVDLIVDGKSAELSVKDLGSALHQVTKELRAMAEADDPAKYRQLLDEKKKISAEYQKQKVAIGDLRSEWDKFVDEFKTVAIGVVGGNILTAALEQAVNFLPEQIDRIIAKKDALADVAKTTNMTDQQVRALRSSLKEVNTRTTLEDLMSLAEVGGQFGVAKREIEGFVVAADKANVAIGKAFGGAAETGESLFKMNNVLKDIEGNTVGDRMTFIANALNVLEAQGAATANGIADYTVRMGGYLGTLGVASKDIIGIAAMLEETGTTAERGSTGVVNVYRAMLSESETFAKVAGMGLKEYQALIQKDMTEALKAYVLGLQKVQGNQLEYNAILEKSKLNGMGEAEVISKMVGNYDMMVEKIELTGKSLGETASITDEFNKKNFEMAVELKRIRQYVSELFMSDTIEDYIGRGLHAVAEFIPVLRTLGKWLSEQRVLWQVLGTALLVYYGNVIKATIVTAGHTTVMIARNAATKIGTALTILDGIAVKATALFYGVLAGEITLAAAAQRVWNAVMLANPLGAFIAVVSALAGAVQLYRENTAEALAIEKKRRDMQVLLKEVTDENGKAQKYLNERVADYTNLSQAERESLKKEILLRKEKLKAQLANIEAKRIELEQMKYEPSVWQDVKNLFTSGSWQEFKIKRRLDAAGNMTEATSQIQLEVDNLKDTLSSYDDTLKQIERLDKSSSSVTTGGGGGGADDDEKKKKKAAKEAKTKLPEITKVSEKDYAVKRKPDVWEEPDMNGAFEQGMVPTEAEYAGKLHGIAMDEINKKISPELAFQQRLAAEEQYLMAKLLLQKTYNESTMQTEQELNDNMMQQIEERARFDIEMKQRMKEAEQALSQARRDAVMEGMEILKGFVGESTALYKALFVAQKAMAIADVIIKLRQELAAIYASNAAFGPAGTALSLTQATTAKVRAGISIATIGAQTLQGFIPKKAEGGYTDMRSLAEGFVDRATLYNLPGRSYIAGEAGKEFILNNTALQHPAIANFANMMDAVQKSKNYGLLGGMTQGSGGSGRNDAALLAELKLLNANLVAMGQRPERPLVFNLDKFREFDDFVNKVFEDTQV